MALNDKLFRLSCFSVIIVAFLLAQVPLAARADETGVQTTPASWWAAVFPHDEDSRAAIDKKTDLLVELLDLPADMPFHEKVDAVRDFVNSNSVHKIDDEFYSYWSDMPQVMSRIAARDLNPDAPPPHVECAVRSVVMYHMLDRMKMRARIVVLRPGKDLNNSHTLVEVQNPETKLWEIQDPDLDIYWIVNAKKGKRAGVQDMLVYPLPASFTPCLDGDKCGYTDRDKEILDRFAYASLMDIQKNDNTLLINRDRFALNNRYLLVNHDQLPTCVLFGKNCRKTVIELDEKTGKP